MNMEMIERRTLAEKKGEEGKKKDKSKKKMEVDNGDNDKCDRLRLGGM